MFSLPVKTHAGAENFGAVCSSGPSLLLDKAWSSTSALTPAAGLAPPRLGVRGRSRATLHPDWLNQALGRRPVLPALCYVTWAKSLNLVSRISKE